MGALAFRLFGKFSVCSDAEFMKGIDGGKEQELLSYLLIHRQRSHPREALATVLWGDTSTERSKKYLRQVLWHLQTALEQSCDSDPSPLQVEHDWVRLNPHSKYWLDVAAFEDAYAAARDVPGAQLDKANAELLSQAVDFYRGDLLEGWYEDWCLFERERLQNTYLSMLDKLMAYCDTHREYETGQNYGYAILRYDPARERTHRQLMHLKYMAGDRTGALRQYERCVAALAKELGVKPERRTVTLYEHVRADSLNGEREDTPESPASVPEVLRRLRRLQVILGSVRTRVQRDIKALELGVKPPKH
jgi:DNA-binding SARP family transcriptional activator